MTFARGKNGQLATKRERPLSFFFPTKPDRKILIAQIGRRGAFSISLFIYFKKLLLLNKNEHFSADFSVELLRHALFRCMIK